MTLASDLKTLIEYIDEHGWIQGRNSDITGRVCLLGGIWKGLPHTGELTSQTSCPGCGLILYLRPIIQARTGYDITDFNDHPGQTWEKIPRISRWTRKGTGG